MIEAFYTLGLGHGAAIALGLVIAMILDARFGEPDALYARAPHPAVLMGRAVGWCEARLNRGSWRRAKGAAAMLALALGAGAVGWVISFGGPILEALLAAALLAQRSLMEHVSAVATALERSLAEGRRAVAMIVGRDPETLDEAAVARAAVESAAENFSDAVVAPAFWFIIAGAPGILIYKMVNTADSMIGHRSERFAAFGWAAARLDDLLNLAPARAAGFLIALASLEPRSLVVMLQDARKHRSPNAGWPEAAAAGALDLALAGPRVYGGAPTEDPFLNENGKRAADADDIRSVVDLIWRAWALTLGLAVLIAALSLNAQ